MQKEKNLEWNIQRLVIIGAAESGVGAAVLGKQHGWVVFVSDAGVIKECYKDVLNHYNIEYEEGKHTPEKILNANCVVKSPGVSEKVEIIKTLRNLGIEICSEIEFGYRYKGNSKIIAVTGSNGKSTTTKLIYEILKADGLDVSMVGNIGFSFAKRVAEAPTEWYVLEVSSFQLDDIYMFRPEISILLNITPDHLDRYGYDISKYIASKFKIAQNQTETDFFIINFDDKNIHDYLTHHSFNSKIIYFTLDSTNMANQDGGYVKNDEMILHFNKEEMNMSVYDLSLKGRHNQYNCMAAGISALITNIRKEKLREVFSGFVGLEHRMEYIATVRGVKFIDDSKATNINSVWYALECMKQPVILILGGQDKGNDYTEILGMVREKVKAIICLAKDTSPIHKAFDGVVEHIVDTLSAKDAVLASYAFADTGDVVLLSPGCASFDLFENFEDRGRKFKEAVINL